ncbi:putative Transmembrane protein [Quillaja saponaria]|uniref:Transmembrane protein n=1 Tax=Quillaja saponaria TaxID=32244 RepID=A0AAD7LIU5_QUISA|nr:putative Transmembrane protein [Quillaja saponaria]
MGVNTEKMSAIVLGLGLVSFILGVFAENIKPSAGTPIVGKGVVICKYQSDPTVALGYASFGFLVASTVAGFLSTFYPYKGKSVPSAALFKSKSLVIFLNLSMATAAFSAALILWPTITEQLHLIHNVHHNLNTDCPTAKTGLIGGGAFLSLNASLLWLASLILTKNAREDYLEELEPKS